ncbi:MAG TPA: pyridoxamine 5'-phosphate oxidase family protein [Bryobacteraceae bacterium]|nr:pyridoxamine 5'-phosphate oxidase family protein [Bryobacteraceae bacterium]
MPDYRIRNREELREVYAAVLERARLKTLPRLDRHCQNFIALSPLLCLGTHGPDGGDVTPRGDAPGFVHVLDDSTLAIPDWRGNNRLDSLENVLDNPKVGLLFFVPGVEETLRVNGTAEISVDPALLGRWMVNGNHPRSVLVVKVREAYLHCGKALIRSKLWQGTYQIPRNQLPSYGQMLKDQIEIADSAEEMQQSVEEAYKNRLY